MKKFFSDFKAFITKGNIVDMAVGVVIGGAFGGIVNSLVNDVILPLVSLATGGVDFTDWKWVIKKAEYDALGVETAAETALRYGSLIQSIVNFLIIAFCIFAVLRVMMRAKARMDKIQAGYKVLPIGQVRAMRKELKARGLTRKEISAAIEERERELTLAAEKERAEKEKTEKPKPEYEPVLTEIRDLLKTLSEKR